MFFINLLMKAGLINFKIKTIGHRSIHRLDQKIIYELNYIYKNIKKVNISYIDI